ncbi:multidrug ABC transporter permease [Phycicoccus sp. Root563]|uniref:bifunctional acetate--CoA ligase family protein/GNAT family N-acetyltransferase n=1 Tax=Phycicoccus sp. Root563 TaxID=1736562 RepID=UPI0007034401|nr:bifunctional GNAT family N-acetyltransferase/acetate--CoA ligase family protein [Phycicoccus sp. Root563]KQZ88585.1 multidrug ABC transporter permease [Phycicoccus sp. Root563]
MTEAAGRPVGYPTQWEADVVLRDGSVAHLRPITPSDVEAVHRFHAGQSDESIYMRFFAPLRKLSDRDVTRFTNVDYHDRVALVATVRGAIIGIGRYDKITATSAEVAFNISDSFQGKGIGSVLLEHLAVIAWESGIEEFTAEVLPQNRKMISVFSEAGYEVSRRFEDGVVSVRFQIRPTERSEAVRLSREHRAESVSMRSVLFPDTIAVVGASRRSDSIGHHILSNIQSAGFNGAVYAVNREAMEVLGLHAHARVSEIPDEVDLAVVAVPAEEVLDVVADCAEADVKTLLVVSAGFAEAGPAGEELQRELLATARAAGMRVLGPNSFGVINNHPSVRLNASLAPELPPAGRLGLFAQSGALGIAVLASAARRGLGISVFASAGNRVDVSGNDFMQYWIDDDDTDAVGLYLESMGNPRKFSRIARRLATTKPVIVVKSGVSSYGVPPGHRARPTRVRPEAFDAMLRQAGVIRVENVHQMFDVAQLVVHQPLPQGNRVAIVGNSDALGALTAEACVSWGLEVAHGPVSLPSDARGEHFAAALADAFGDPEVDSVLTCFIPPLVTEDAEVAAAVRDAAIASDKPCLATFLGMRGVLDRLSDQPGAGRVEVVPAYAMPEDAVRALAAATRYSEWRSKDRGVQVNPVGIDREAAEALVERVLTESPEGRRLTHAEVTSLLSAYGVDLWGSVPARTVDDAVAAAEAVGYPVVIKSVAPLMRHQPGLSGIRVDLRTEGQVREAFAGLTERLAPLSANSFVVQRMATPGVSCVVRSDEDPLFGPVVSFSIAGPPTDLLGDIGHRIPPLTDVDVSDLISSVKSSPMLHGHRGSTPVHRAALADLIARVSVLADNLPEVSSLVLNPVNAHPSGVDVLGAEAVVAPTPRRKDPGRRTLT